MTTQRMLTVVKEKLGARTDVDLCNATGITPQQLSKLRAGTLGFGPAHLIRLHEATNINTLELKRLLESAK